MNINIIISALKRRTPEEWLALVETVEEPTRTFIAQVVWWDFFAGRENSKRWPHLDAYLKNYLVMHPAKTPKPESLMGETRGMTDEEKAANAKAEAEAKAAQKIEDLRVRDEMRVALVGIGYPEELAKRRVK